jgi:hypothetical protein
MFGWLKRFGQSADLAVVGTAAVNIWKQSVTESRSQRERAYADDPQSIAYWQIATGTFIVKWQQIHKGSLDDYQVRKNAIVSLIDSEVLKRGVELSPTEVDLLGEFAALAMVRGIKEALMFGPERSSIVFDLFPRDYWEEIGYPPSKFNDWYRGCTGKVRRPRT